MIQELRKCQICPRECKVDRINRKKGNCMASDKVEVALISLHMYEEPCISGENYSVSYWASFAQLAQAQRHRTLSYEIYEPTLYEDMYFIPPIIEGTELEDEWLEDIESLAEYFPQGKMVFVNERGTVENFVLKCKERLCGCAQLEIALQTRETLKEYLRNTERTNERVYNYLKQYMAGARCTFPDYHCDKPCIWGAKNALDRMI